jgi:hypothetical protein
MALLYQMTGVDWCTVAVANMVRQIQDKVINKSRDHNATKIKNIIALPFLWH